MNDSNSSTDKTPLSACARLYQLLSTPPQKNKSDTFGESIPQFIVGTAGVQLSSPLIRIVETFDENTNQIARALAACKLGLFVHPTDNDTYIRSKDLDDSSLSSGLSVGK